MWIWIKDHPELCLIALYLVGKIVVRLTPTKKDNAIFDIIEGIVLRYWSKIPNFKKGGGKFN